MALPTADAAATLVSMGGQGAREPLFLPHALAGNVYPYAQLARSLAPVVDCYGIESAALRRFGSPPASIEQISAAYVEGVRAARPGARYLLAGWSMGGLIAFDMARQLEQRGEDIGVLALIDTIFPEPPAIEPTSGELAAAYAAELARTLDRPPSLPDGFETWERPDQLRWIEVHLGSRAAGIRPAELARRVSAFSAHLRMASCYRPRPLRVPTVLFLAAGSPENGMRWGGVASALRIVRMAGDHAGLLRRPYAQLVAGEILAAAGHAAA